MEPTVLVVDDEPRIRQLYATWLEAEYAVRRAADGQEALDVLDETVDVVLLDRRMPGPSGDEVLDELRERGHDPWVVMVTAVDPAADIIALPFDDYLVKPVERDDLFEAIEAMLARGKFGDDLRGFFESIAKLGVLEATHSQRQLTDDEDYARLKAEYLERRQDVAEQAERLRERGAYEELFIDLPELDGDDA